MPRKTPPGRPSHKVGNHGVGVYWVAGTAPRFLLEPISKMSFGPNPVLGSRFKSSKYKSIHPKGTSFGRLRVETRARLDFEPKSYF